MNRPNWRSLDKIGLIVAVMMVVAYGTPGWADSAVYETNPDRPVLGRAPGSLRGEIEYLRRVRGWTAEIAIVAAKERPKCAPVTRLDGCVTDTIYCGVPIQYVELIDGNPENRVRIHYWFPDESDIVTIAPGTRILVFLAPSVIDTTYVCTVMMRATEENLAAVRAALKAIDS